MQIYYKHLKFPWCVLEITHHKLMYNPSCCETFSLCLIAVKNRKPWCIKVNKQAAMLRWAIRPSVRWEKETESVSQPWSLHFSHQEGSAWPMLHIDSADSAAVWAEHWLKGIVLIQACYAWVVDLVKSYGILASAHWGCFSFPLYSFHCNDVNKCKALMRPCICF